MSRVLAALVLVLGSPALAGCLGADEPAVEPTGAVSPVDGLSEAVFAVLDGVSRWVEASSDDTRLHTRLFLPDTGDVDWNAPTILVMSPYFGYSAREDALDASSRPTYFRYQWLIDHFVPRGYAVALSDVRGTGDSGGCLEQTASLQRQDGYDVVEWLAAQDWSNGRVGMFGKSYDAETQQGTAVLAPPHLTTIVPVASVSGQYEWNFYDGVPFTLHTLLGNAAYMAGDGLEPPTTPEGIVQYPTRPGCHPVMLSQAAYRDGDWDAYWADRELRPLVGNIQASVLYVHGLQDWNVRHTAIRDWFDQIPSAKRALFGQWAHDYPEENRWNDAWSRTDWRDTVHRWYDHYLLGLDNGILEALPPVQVQDSAGVWRAEPDYPPSDTTPFTLHLAPGALVAEPPAEAGGMYLRENEEAFVRANTRLPVPDADTSPVEPKLVFTSEPLDQTLHVSGWTVLEMEVVLFDGLTPDPDDEIDAHFAANLYVVGPDGEPAWYNSGYLSARHRNGVDDPKPVPEDEPVMYRLRFHPEETVLPAGSRLMLTLAGSDEATEPEGSFFGAEVVRGTLVVPTIERDWGAVTLDIPFGAPVTS